MQNNAPQSNIIKRTPSKQCTSYSPYRPSTQQNDVKRCNDIKNIENKIHKLEKTESELDGKVEYLEEKVELLSNKIANSMNCVDIIDDVDNRIDEMDIQISKLNGYIKPIVNRDRVKISIDNFCFESCINVTDIGNSHTEVHGVFKLSNLKINDINGKIKFNKTLIPSGISICDIYGTISIMNLENNVKYDGMIYFNKNIQYTLSNRPLIPIGIVFNALMMINFKIII